MKLKKDQEGILWHIGNIQCFAVKRILKVIVSNHRPRSTLDYNKQQSDVNIGEG